MIYPKLPPRDPAADEEWMRLALKQARLAAERDEPPVGCVMINELGEVVSIGGNCRQAMADPFAHAEAIAIRGAASAHGDWRLDAHTLVVTLEPCPMCAGLILMARVGRVIYGASNEKWGAAGTRLDLLGGRNFPHKPDVHGGVLAPECAAILTEYFKGRRARGRAEGGDLKTQS